MAHHNIEIISICELMIQLIPSRVRWYYTVQSTGKLKCMGSDEIEMIGVRARWYYRQYSPLGNWNDCGQSQMIQQIIQSTRKLKCLGSDEIEMIWVRVRCYYRQYSPLGNWNDWGQMKLKWLGSESDDTKDSTVHSKTKMLGGRWNWNNWRQSQMILHWEIEMIAVRKGSLFNTKHIKCWHRYVTIIFAPWIHATYIYKKVPLLLELYIS